MLVVGLNGPQRGQLDVESFVSLCGILQFLALRLEAVSDSQSRSWCQKMHLTSVYARLLLCQCWCLQQGEALECLSKHHDITLKYPSYFRSDSALVVAQLAVPCAVPGSPGGRSATKQDIRTSDGSNDARGTRGKKLEKQSMKLRAENAAYT